MKSSSPRNNQQVTEITGTPAHFWGNTLIPSRGTIILKITGDILLVIIKTGLEKKESWTRIQNIDSIEIIEAPLQALLAIGTIFASTASLITLVNSSLFNSLTLGACLLVLGFVLIIFSLINKRQYLVIYSHRYTIPVFINKSPEVYQQFAMNLLAIAKRCRLAADR